MTSKKITWLILTMIVLASLSIVVAACGSDSSDTAATEADTTDAATTEDSGDAATTEDSSAAAAVEIPGPSEYPEGQEIFGAREIEKLPIDQMVAYRAFDSYGEPDWVSDLVAEGKLPPVAERLPEEPRVILTSGMSDGIGTYGGVWRDFSACPTEGYNRGAGQTAGWFGIHAAIFGELVKSGPIYRRSDALEPLPYLAKDWEWSDDGFELTVNLMKGVKWSDGHPFTTEDVLFTWEDMIVDPNVQSPKGASAWEYNGEMTQMEVIDDYSFKFIFPIEKPVQALFQMDQGDFHLSPAHFLKPLHPKYNDDTDYVEFESAMHPEKIPVVLGAWVPVEYKTDELLVLRRNPYYFAVDEAGNQLPYLDEVVFEKGPSGVGRTIQTMAGAADHSNLENPSTFIETLKRAEDEDAHFYVEWGPETLGYSAKFNYSSLGAETDRDVGLRELFRDIRFRKAISFGLDRDGIAQSILRGPFLRGWAGGLFPGSSYFDRSSVSYYNNNPEAAKALLADLGLEDTDGDGILNFTEGPAAGENLVISVISAQGAEETQSVAEAMVTLLGELGIKINVRILDSAASREANESGKWDMEVDRDGQVYAVPFTKCTDLAPVTKEFSFHREGSEPRNFMPFEEELIDIVNRFCIEPDTDVRKELMAEYNRISTENIYFVGVFVGRYGLAAAKRFKNIPAGMPVFLYDWTWQNSMPEQVWVDPGEQLDQIRPGVIPTYEQ